MKVVVRIDDITPDMDWVSFWKFKELLDRYGIKPLLGIVPDNQDSNLKKGEEREDFWVIMKGLYTSGWSIAQHGYRHLYTTKKAGLFPLNHFSEFAGLPYEMQRHMLKEGQEILQKHGLETEIFMAPGHSYDKNTLKALNSLGFSYVTDGYSNVPYCSENMTFLPIAYQRSACFQEKEGVTTLVYHLNGMKQEQYLQYEKELSKLKGMPPYSELLKPAQKKQNLIMKIRETGMAVMKHYIVQLIKGR